MGTRNVSTVKSSATPLRDYLELGRVSNLPTCLSNVLVGCSIDATHQEGIVWGRLALVALSVALLYTGGMAMNDLFDESYDREERPDRPLPSGRLTRSSAIVFMALCLAGGVGLLVWMGGATLYLGLLLLGLITLYNVTHKRISAAFLLMGACRATVYTLAASSVMWPPAWWFVLGFGSTLFVYTSMITLIARSENRERLGRQRFLSWGMPALFVPPIFLPSYVNPFLMGVGFVLGVGWMLRAIRFVWQVPPRTKDAILTWLSGMCLLDAFFLTLLDQPILFVLALGCFALTHWGHQRVSGT